MPLGGNTDTATTTATTVMQAEPNSSPLLAAPTRESTPSNDRDEVAEPQPTPSTEYEFDASKCLFCNQSSPDLDDNLTHMSRTHGLHVDATHLLVEVERLLAYLHLVVARCHECLYCGTRRGTRQAVQQHMVAKGHCRYDVSREGSELKDFYASSSSSSSSLSSVMEEEEEEEDDDDDDGDEKEDDDDEPHFHLRHLRFSSESPSSPRRRRRPKPRKPRASKPDRDTSPSPSPPPSSSPSSSTTTTTTITTTTATHPPPPFPPPHDNLRHIRASDRATFLHHLTTTTATSQQQQQQQQQHHQLITLQYRHTDTALRTAQTQRTNLDRAASRVNCLRKIRLVRKPPHTGNVFSLKR